MTIESKDEAAGPDPLTPIFTQRKIEGVARIPNGKTMMIASIAQDRETNGRTGLPLVGLIPILGRLFTAPNKNNSQSDIVITMTPRVLRAPEITPEDLMPRNTGTMQTPESPSLEALIRDADREDQVARARALPTNQTVQLPPQPGEDVTFVPAPKALAAPDATTGGATAKDAATSNAPATNNTTSGAPPVNVSLNTTNAVAASASASNNAVSPAPAVVKEAPTAPAPNNNAGGTTSAPASNNTTNAPPAVSVTNAQPAAAPAESTAELLLMPEQQEIKVGERRRVMVFLKTDAPLGLATATLRFDPRALAVRSVSQGILAADKPGAPVLTQSLDPSGVLLVSVAPAPGAQPLTGEGLLLVIEVEALAQGDAALQFDADKVHLIATDGRTVRPRISASKFKITQ